MYKIYLFVDRVDRVNAAPLNLVGLYCYLEETRTNIQIGYVQTEDAVGDAVVKVLTAFYELDSCPLEPTQFVVPNHSIMSFIKSGTNQERTDAQLPLIKYLTKLKELGGKFKRKAALGKEEYIHFTRADCSAALARVAYERNGEPLSVVVMTDKEFNVPAKNRPTLLRDKYLFNWEPTEEVVLTNGEAASVYYSGNGNNDKKTSKKNQHLDTTLLDKSFVYYTGSNMRLKSFGMKSVEERRNVVILKKPVAAVDNLMKHQSEVLETLEVRPMVMGRTADIMGSGIGKAIEDDDFSRVAHTNRGDLYRLAKTRSDLTYVCNPPRLGPRIRNTLIENKIKLMNHINGVNEGIETVVTDITDLLYDYTTDAKGKDKTSLKSILTSNTKYLQLPDIAHSEGKVKIKMLFVYDCPPIADLKLMAKDNPKVEMLVRRTDMHELSYALVITTDEGWLYYMSPYSSKALLRKSSKRNRG